MRLRELHLERYGPFTGERLAFRENAQLHVVYGPNEAGKSCSLAAITDLLFGIERQTRYDFLHEGKEMRLGATIAAGGASFAFRRRKGNKGTLLDAAGNALPDDALAPFLGGLTREVFRRAFGLDAAALRASGEELKRSDGELGASLFAAASGLRGFHDLRAALDREAEAVFAPRRSQDRRFYQALDRYEEARKAIRERELKAGDWKALNEAVAACAARLDEIGAARATNAAEEARLSRLKRAAPILALIDAEEDARAALGPLPSASPGTAERLGKALGTVEAARARRMEAARRGERLAGEHVGIAVDETVLAAAAEIERLADTSAYAKSRADLPRVETEGRELTAALEALVVRLGLTDAAAVAARQPSDAAQARVQDLLEEYRQLDTDRRSRTDEVRRYREALADLERQREERGPLVDPGPAREKFAAFVPELSRLAQRDAVAAAIRTEARRLAEEAGRLAPPVRDIDALAGASLPSAEAVTRARTAWEKLEETLRRERDRLEAADTEARDLAARLRALVADRAVPTPEILAAARGERDAQWRRLRAGLFGGSEALAGAALAEAVAAFERQTAEADRLADAVAQDAERIAAHAADSGRLAAAQETAAEARSRIEAVEAERAAARADWETAWAGAGIVPLPPGDMGPWLVAAENLLARREALLARRDELAAIEAEAARIAPGLAALATELGLSPVAGADAPLTARRIEDRLKLLSEVWEGARDLDARLRATAAALAAAEAAERETGGRVEAWRSAFAAAVRQVGLAPEATPAEAAAALAAWKEVPGVLREREKLMRRVDGMRRDMAAFEAAATAVLRTCAADLAAHPADTAAKALAQRLREALDAQTRRGEKAAQLAEARDELARAAGDVESAEAELAAMAESLGWNPGGDLGDLARRLAEHERLTASLKERRRELAHAADGHGETALREALATFDPDAAEAELARLRQADETLDREGKERFAEKDRHERRLKELEQGVGAEVALQQRRGAEAELAEAARDYAVLKLGALLVGAALGRRRASRQEPLIERAGVLFSTLTGGAFDGLAQEFDDDDAPLLAGRRASGATVRVGDMSEGTRDQLYLALRLAYLEHYAERAAPAPFIADDLFASFDDDRTGHGLETLAAIGAKVQPILFTHHRHVVEIAASRLGSAVDIVEIGAAQREPRAAERRIAAAE